MDPVKLGGLQRYGCMNTLSSFFMHSNTQCVSDNFQLCLFQELCAGVL